MTATKLDPSIWKEYFDDFSKRSSTMLVEIEVASLDLGDQFLTEWVPLRGISYDPKDDILLISLGKQGTQEVIEHLIRNPREVYVDQELIGINSIGVKDKDGRMEIVKFREVLKLPPASWSAKEEAAAEPLEPR